MANGERIKIKNVVAVIATSSVPAAVNAPVLAIVAKIPRVGAMLRVVKRLLFLVMNDAKQKISGMIMPADKERNSPALLDIASCPQRYSGYNQSTRRQRSRPADWRIASWYKPLLPGVAISTDRPRRRLTQRPQKILVITGPAAPTQALPCRSFAAGDEGDEQRTGQPVASVTINSPLRRPPILSI